MRSLKSWKKGGRRSDLKSGDRKKGPSCFFRPSEINQDSEILRVWGVGGGEGGKTMQLFYHLRGGRKKETITAPAGEAGLVTK